MLNNGGEFVAADRRRRAVQGKPDRRPDRVLDRRRDLQDQCQHRLRRRLLGHAAGQHRGGQMAGRQPAGQWRISTLSRPPRHGLHEFGALPEQAIPGHEVALRPPNGGTVAHGGHGDRGSAIDLADVAVHLSAKRIIPRQIQLVRRTPEAGRPGDDAHRQSLADADPARRAESEAPLQFLRRLCGGRDLGRQDRRQGRPTSKCKERKPVGDGDHRSCRSTASSRAGSSSPPAARPRKSASVALPRVALAAGRHPRASAWRRPGTGQRQAAHHQQFGLHHLRHPDRIQFLDLRQGHQICPYFFQREDVGSRHAEFYDNFTGRNKVLWRLHLQQSWSNGSPASAAQRTIRSGTNFTNFGDKYGEGQLRRPHRDRRADDRLHPQSEPDRRQPHLGQPVRATPPPTARSRRSACAAASGPHAATWFIASRPRPRASGAS